MPFLCPAPRTILFLTTAFATLLPSGAAPTRVQQALTVNEVPELHGYLGERWQANRANSLHPFDIGKYTRLVEQRTHRDWWWAGEQDGKWLESAVLSSAHSDPVLREKAKSVLSRIIASQEPDGYVGITPKDIRTPGQPLRGMDPYELYFRLHALITAYEQWGDQTALVAAGKLGDYFINHIGPGKAEFWPGDLRPPQNRGKVLQGFSKIAGHSVHYSWEGTLLIDPMLRLAQTTGDARYTQWSRWVVENIDKWSGWDSFSKLDQVADGTLGIHQVQPYVHAHTFHMNFLGFLRLYEITGNPSYLRKVAGAWTDIASRQMYITGGVSVAEHYEAGHIKPVSGNAVETCATMSWLQTTQYLLELTGEVRYADAMEKLLWNHVFAAQTVDGDSYRYHTPPNGVKPEGCYHGPDCCTASGHRMVSLLPTYLYGKDETGVFINQYGASTADVKLSGNRSLRLTQHTTYPETSTVRITIDAAADTPLTLRLRLPAWCADPQVSLNGSALAGIKPGTYLPIRRIWKAGDTIQLDFPMRWQWVKSDAPWRTLESRLPGGEIMHHPVGNDTPPWALTRGPLVYAADTVWWNDSRIPAPHQVGEDLAVVPDPAAIREIPKPGPILGPACEAEFITTSGTSIRVPMVPFTNIGQWFRPGQPKPDRNSSAFSYAVWFLEKNAPVFQDRIKQTAQHHAQFANAVDFIEIGNPESEQAHHVSGGIVGSFKNRSYRHGDDFRYVIKLPPGRDGHLIVTYWGGDSGREFDVLADGKVVDTQKLENARPGVFFDQACTVPSSLIQNRTNAYGQPVETVTLRFKTRNTDVAGGVFAIRME